MEKRTFNIFFHLHTVSGIVISVLLYVIFFAGSFSFFRDEIVNWERGDVISNNENLNINVDEVLNYLNDSIPLKGREITFSRSYRERRIAVNIGASNDSLLEGRESSYFFYLDPKTYKTYSYEGSYTLGEFLYRLHFFAQIPYPVGYYLSGFTALFLIFALVTGVLIHWKKIISNFFQFRPFAKWKTVWTDLHTVLGTIGIPFQFVYAVTGAFFMIKIFLLAPNLMVLYGGDEAKIYEDLGYGEPKYEYLESTLISRLKIQELIEQTRDDWKDFDLKHIHVFNYGDQGMHVALEGELDHKKKLTAFGTRIYSMFSGELVLEKNPYNETSYLDGVKNLMNKLHYGNYGGIGLRLASFILGLGSCFVILSGVLIWIEARKKQKLPEKRKTFNAWVGHAYLSICLTMYPVTAFSFILVKFVPLAYQEQQITILYVVYFLLWLLLSSFFLFKKNDLFTTKYTLLIGGLLAFLIPVVNGAQTGAWLWLSVSNNVTDNVLIELLWIILGGLSSYHGLKLKRTF